MYNSIGHIDTEGFLFRYCYVLQRLAVELERYGPIIVIAALTAVCSIITVAISLYALYGCLAKSPIRGATVEPANGKSFLLFLLVYI